ncbi:MAG TPA: hypothetical protein VGL03_15695, partial [Thermoanaerobaculia bacterium]
RFARTESIQLHHVRQDAPALKEAVELDKDSGAELRIAHAHQPPSSVQADSFATGVFEDWDQNLRTAVTSPRLPARC